MGSIIDVYDDADSLATANIYIIVCFMMTGMLLVRISMIF